MRNNMIDTMQLFGSSGIRRVANSSLFELALKVATAIGKRYNRVVVGCDTRTSSDALRHLVMAGLMASGAQVFDAGLLPTPTLALAARKFDAGVMVTASHNPPEYNGLKLLNPDGSAFDPNQQSEIQELVSDLPTEMVSWERIHSSEVYRGAIEQHMNHIQRQFPGKFKLKVVLDCACGAASVITPYLLKNMGCEILALNSNASGFFPHPVEPLPGHLSDLMNAVRGSSADLGLVHDGDADRLMAVDNNGHFISGDNLFNILAIGIGAKKVVTTIDASSAIDDAGFDIVRTRVGDSYVSEELKNGGDFGGEPSGAWIFPKNSLCPDGIYAAACLVDIASRDKLSELAVSIPSYTNLRSNIVGDNVDITQLETDLASAFQPISTSYVDGLKLCLDDCWILVRPSGTEPKIRLTVEGKDQMKVRDIHTRAIKIIKGVM
jgi:phosphoglucosamine mutase